MNNITGLSRPSRTRRVAAVAAWTFVVLAITSSAALAQRGSRGSSLPPIPSFGVNFHGTWTDYTDAQRLQVLDDLAASHVQWVRIDIGWASFVTDCRTCYEQWYIDLTDFLVNAALDRGLKVLGMVDLTPSWANGGADVYTPPTNPNDYGTMMKWAAKHFRGRVAAWEIWNEPNEEYFWHGTPEQYVGLLKSAYKSIKRGDSKALVVMGGPDYNDTDWLTKLYQAGAQGSFDVLATHPYQGVANLPPETADTKGDDIYLISHVPAVHDLMVQYGDGDKPIWFTEFGWSSHKNVGGEENWDLGVTDQEQGDYLNRTLTYVGTNFPYVTNVFWYNERNLVEGDLQGDNYGLLNHDLSTKPSYASVKSFLGQYYPGP